jgi:hypothetical protein
MVQAQAPNRRFLFDTFRAALRALRRAAKPERWSAAMSCTRLLVGLIVTLSAVSCSSHHVPTILPTPAEAKDVNSFPFLGGQAFETHFVLNVRYPSTAAVEHYGKLINRPWYRCVWGNDGWDSYLDVSGVDSKGRTSRTVHRYNRMWVNPQAKRSLLLALTYYSDPAPDPRRGIGSPDNESQQVILVEYFSQDIKDEIRRLKLQCPPEVDAAL